MKEYSKLSENKTAKLTENVDVSVSKNISVYVACITLYHHHITPSTAVILAY